MENQRKLDFEKKRLDFDEIAYKLTNYDQNAEMNAFCDDLEIEIMMAYQSEIERLERMKHDQLEEIKSYRADLQKWLNASKTYEFIISQNKITETLIEEFVPKATTAITEALEILSHGNVDEQLLESKNETFEECIEMLKYISERKKWLTFNGKYAKFEVDNLFSMRLLGTIEYSLTEHFPIQNTKSKNSVMFKNTS